MEHMDDRQRFGSEMKKLAERIADADSKERIWRRIQRKLEQRPPMPPDE